jgi:hypothetical protein
VLLLEPAGSTHDPSPREEKKETTGEQGQEEVIISVHDWAAIPAICPCKKEKSG